MTRKGRLIKKYSIRTNRKTRIPSIPSPRLYTPRDKLYDCIWRFKIGDADDKPSVPHAHAKETGYRLNAWTGEVYPAGNERIDIIGNLKPKELAKLHKDPKFIDFARKQIEWYREANPQTTFYVPEWFELKYMQARVVVMKKPEEISEFVFMGQVNIRE